jgi:hypothetical protein
MKNFSSKEIRFSGDSIKSCVGFIDLVSKEQIRRKPVDKKIFTNTVKKLLD